MFAIVPLDRYFSVFHVIQDLDDDGTPRPYIKNPGGGADTPTVNRYFEDCMIGESDLAHLNLQDRTTLLRLAVAAELWEETGFFVRPDELDSFVLVHEEHVPDRESDGVHVRITFLLTFPFAGDPKLGKEIAEGFMLSAKQIVHEFPKEFPPHHLEAFRLVIEAMGEGRSVEPKTSCRVGTRCQACLTNTNKEGSR